MSERKFMKKQPPPNSHRGRHPYDWSFDSSDEDLRGCVVDGKPHPKLNRAQRRKVAKMMNLDS